MSQMPRFWENFWVRVGSIPSVVPEEVANQIRETAGGPDSHFTHQFSNGSNCIVWIGSDGCPEFYAFFPSPQESPPRD
jgi:hypothetical protein